MLHCVCTGSDDNDMVQQFSSKTTSTSTVNCSPRWIVYPKSFTKGHPFWLNRGARTQHTCLDACVSNTSCVAVEWVPVYPQCRIHHEMHHERTWHPGITRFELVRRCNPTSGTWREQALFHIIAFDQLL